MTTTLPMQGRPVWCELLTTDTQAAKTFYGNVVGWTYKPFEGSPAGPYHVIHRPDDQSIGGIMPIPQGMNFPPHWEMYIAVVNIEDTVAKIERLGGSALSGLIDVPNVGRLRTMKDPQGAVFAIIQPAPMPGEERPEAEPVDGDVSWRELYTTDAPGALKFYQEVFGWQDAGSFDMGPMGTYYMFGRAHALGGIMTKTPDMASVPTSWSLYFRVSEINAATERVKTNGGRILNGPMEVPGGDQIVQCMDPQGAAFSLHQKK